MEVFDTIKGSYEGIFLLVQRPIHCLMCFWAVCGSYSACIIALDMEKPIGDIVKKMSPIGKCKITGIEQTTVLE